MSPYFTAALEGNGKTVQNVSEKGKTRPKRDNAKKHMQARTRMRKDFSEKFFIRGSFRQVFRAKKGPAFVMAGP